MNLTELVEWKSLPGSDDITRVVLENGVTLLTRSNFNSPSVVISGYLGCGSWFDPDDRLGLAYFTALGLMRGTQKRSHHQLYDALESVGASLGFSSSVHNANFAGRSLVEDMPLLLEVLSEALREPVFPTGQMEKLRARMLTSLAIRAQDTGDMASMTFDEIVFKDHPYGRPEDGYIETIQRITRADLETFHNLHYGPKGMVIVVVGAVSPEEVISRVRQVIGDWENPDQPEPDGKRQILPLEETVRRHIIIPGKSQADLIMGTLGPRRCSPDYLSASLGNSVLGQFGMMGRIGDVVREQAGIAYQASTSLNAWIESGSWEVSAGVNPQNLNRAVDLILSELNRFVREPVTREELSDSQSNFIGRMPLSLESNAGVANALLNLERFDLGLDYYRSYPKLVQDVTVEMVLETAHRYLDPARLAIVSAGSLPEA